MFGFKIIRTGQLDRIKAEFRMAASMRLRAELADRSSEISRVVARVARGAAKDYLEEAREAGREKFEADPQFQAWAAQQRETAQAEADEAQQTHGFEQKFKSGEQLRFALLGLLMEHGAQPDWSFEQVFPGVPFEEIMAQLKVLMDRGLVRKGDNEIYTAPFRALAALPLSPGQEDGAGR